MIDNRLKRCSQLIEREEYAQAWPIASELLNENPENAKALYLAGWVLRSQGHVGMAIQFFRRALAFEPKIPNIWMHYGACLHDTHRYDEAREAFRVVAKALPADPMPLSNIAASYVQEGKAREAVEYSDRALAMDPEHRIASIAKAFGCLALGRWADGWERAQYLYGESLVIRVYNPPESEEPQWDGSPGKTVVVQADQGLGDIIMFSQCLPQMMDDCKQVILETSPRLAPLMRRNFPGLTVYETMKQSTDVEWPQQYQIDAHIHISYLGKFYRAKNEDFPRKAYLIPDAERVLAWQRFLQTYPRPWVGIAWKGGIQRTNEQARSMELADLAPILKHGGTFVSLAYQEVGLEVARWNIDNREQVICPSLKNDGDYEHTLALIAALDKVITVTTTVAHACGAMGKPASVLVNKAPQWRYAYRCGDGMIWYPENSVELYRQAPGERDWDHAIARVAKDYGAYLSLAKAA
jgi:hypothetical protein